MLWHLKDTMNVLLWNSLITAIKHKSHKHLCWFYHECDAEEDSPTQVWMLISENVIGAEYECVSDWMSHSLKYEINFCLLV